jgi:UDP-glucose 4-epimerase
MGNTYLITGGAGFIGAHLAERLLSKGHRVLALDDLSTGQYRNVEHLRSCPTFELTVDSVMNRPLLATLVDRADYIFHLAAVVGVKRVLESPVRTIEINVRATDSILDLANVKSKPILVASTSEVYGKSAKQPLNEEGDLAIGSTSRPRWSYATSKALDECLAIAYYREKGLPVVVVRLFNTVGPRQSARYGMVLPRFVEQALAGKPLTVYGDGTQRRCFGFVGDVVWALSKLVENSAAYGKIFNVGSQEEVSMTELAERVRGRIGSSSPIVYVPYAEAYDADFEDTPQRVPDTTKLRELIGFDAKTTLNDIIDRIADAYRSTQFRATA